MATPLPKNEAQFDWDELVSLLGGRVVQRPAESDLVGVSTDSRGDLSGRLFVPLRGERFDGHDYVAAAAAAGARAVLLAADYKGSLRLPEGVGVLVVSDTLVALGELARRHRRRWGGRLFAVAGSAGKTTTRSLLTRVFSALCPGLVASTRGNLNNRIGVPLTLLALDERAEIAVVELGTNQPGEIRELCRISEPDAGILTLIDLEHTEGLGDLDGVEAEERELFAFLAARGQLIGNLDDIRVRGALGASPRARSIGYSASDERPSAPEVSVRVRLVARELLPDLRQTLVIDVDGRSIHATICLTGWAGVYATLGSVAAAEAWFPGQIDGSILEHAAAHAGEAGRSTLRSHESGALVVDDSYNSNPRSAELGISTAREIAAARAGRLILVLGSMLELGELSLAAHRELGIRAAQAGAAHLIFVGEEARVAALEAEQNATNVRWVATALEAKTIVDRVLERQDVLLLKGSRGVRLEQVLAERGIPASSNSATSGAAGSSSAEGTCSR